MVAVDLVVAWAAAKHLPSRAYHHCWDLAVLQPGSVGGTLLASPALQGCPHVSDGDRAALGVKQIARWLYTDYGEDQKVKYLFCPVAAKGRAVGRGLPEVSCSTEPFSSSCMMWPVSLREHQACVTCWFRVQGPF